MVLGVGLLSDKRKDLLKHIATTPLFIYFDTKTGDISLGPEDQIVDFSLELDTPKADQRLDVSKKISSQLAKLNDDFWTNEDFYNFLKSWTKIYNRQGQFRRDFQKNNMKNEPPTLTVSPAILMRKRKQRVFTRFYSEAIKKLEEGGSISPCLRFITDFRGKSMEIKKTSDTSASFHEKYYFSISHKQRTAKHHKTVLHRNGCRRAKSPRNGKNPCHQKPYLSFSCFRKKNINHKSHGLDLKNHKRQTSRTDKKSVCGVFRTKSKIHAGIKKIR